jgi:uncharacterized oligopeptide transporter (OPT) family protein
MYVCVSAEVLSLDVISILGYGLSFSVIPRVHILGIQAEFHIFIHDGNEWSVLSRMESRRWWVRVQSEKSDVESIPCLESNQVRSFTL